MKSTDMTTGTWVDYTAPRGSLSENWCCILIGVTGIIMFVAGYLYVVFGNQSPGITP